MSSNHLGNSLKSAVSRVVNHSAVATSNPTRTSDSLYLPSKDRGNSGQASCVSLAKRGSAPRVMVLGAEVVGTAPVRNAVEETPVTSRALKNVSVAHRAPRLTRIQHFGGCMENGQNGNSSIKAVERYDVGHVQEVIRQAHDELRQLLHQRGEIMKRIGTVKQTIAGLANLFGDSVLNEELLELVDRKSNGRQPGFTKACRMMLMESGRAMSARDICDYFDKKLPAMLARHKDPMASVTTVLNRLVEYGEAEAVVSNGRRAWRWVAESAADSLAATTNELRC